MSKLPKYVSDYGHGQICCAAPVEVRDIDVYAFPLRVDLKHLRSFLDAQLNSLPGSPITYEVPLPLVLHSYLDEKFISPVEPIGHHPQGECTFMVPVRQRGGDGDGCWRVWMPYFFIDLAHGMVSGREIWGYRKALARMTFNVPDDVAQNASLAVETLVFDPLAKTTRGKLADLLRVEGRARRVTAEASSVEWHQIASPLRGAADLLDSALTGTLDELLGNSVIGGRLTVINLKQIRDAVDSTRACYQALVESPCRVHSFSKPALLRERDYELSILRCASHPLVADLGLRPTRSSDTHHHFNLPVGLRFKMSFDALPGDVVWDATAAARK